MRLDEKRLIPLASPYSVVQTTRCPKSRSRDTGRAMSQENVELLGRAHAAFTGRDLDALLALCDPDVEVVSMLMDLEGGHPFRGHDGVRRWYGSLLDIYPDYGSEIEEVRELGDVTIARMRQRGRGRESDAPIEQTNWQVVHARSGKIIRWCFVRTEAEALEAAGLSE
jgi:ketosteroid isomerase-like protein